MTEAVERDPHRRRIEHARIAVGVAFAMNGFAYAGWLSRAPAVRADLGLSTAGFGLLLLCLSGAAVTALPLSGALVHRVGPARAVLLGSMSVTAGLLALAGGTLSGAVGLAGLGLALSGLGSSTWDVAMNVEGADVEQRLGRTLMPRFHAGFSLGTVSGAGVGALAAGLGVPVHVQLVGTGVLVGGAMLVVVRRFLPVRGGSGASRQASGALGAWREPRTLLIGLIVLGFAFTEGTANEWLAITLVDGYGAGEVVGALGFGTFVTAMTVARMVGGTALERWGRVAVLRGTAVLALGGLLLVVSAVNVPVALAGAVLWGAGASLGFPVGMSSAADDPVRAAVRVSVVSSIGYAAFLAGPPLIGFLAEHFGVLRALLVVIGALALALACVPAARPLPVAEPAVTPRERPESR